MTPETTSTGLTIEDLKTLLYYALSIIGAGTLLIFAFVKLQHNEIRNTIKENTVAIITNTREVDKLIIKSDMMDHKLDGHTVEIIELKKNIQDHNLRIYKLENT